MDVVDLIFAGRRWPQMFFFRKCTITAESEWVDLTFLQYGN